MTLLDRAEQIIDEAMPHPTSKDAARLKALMDEHDSPLEFWPFWNAITQAIIEPEYEGDLTIDNLPTPNLGEIY